MGFYAVPFAGLNDHQCPDNGTTFMKFHISGSGFKVPGSKVRRFGTSLLATTRQVGFSGIEICGCEVVVYVKIETLKTNRRISNNEYRISKECILSNLNRPTGKANSHLDILQFDAGVSQRPLKNVLSVN